jgi:hypothetical protein
MIRFILILILLGSVGCDRLGVRLTTPDISAEKAHVSVVLACHVVGLIGEPAKPDDEGDKTGKCENCNGKGKVGDGRVMVTCEVCGGTGKATKEIESESQEPKAAPTVKRVDMYTFVSGCPACDAWLHKEEAVWRSHGFDVRSVPYEGLKKAPVFRVFDGDYVGEFDKSLTWEKYASARKTR